MAKPGRKSQKSPFTEAAFGKGHKYQSRDSRGRWSKNGNIKVPLQSTAIGKIDFNNFNPNVTTIKDYSINVRENDVLGIIEIANPTISQIYEQLRMSVCTLFFYKKTNGEYRRMVCTLQGHEPVPSKYNKQGVIVVWDVEHDNWRSFYPNRIFKLVRNEQTTVQ